MDPDGFKKYQNTEHAMVILNHRGDIDWMIGWVLIERAGMLGVSGRDSCYGNITCMFGVPSIVYPSVM